MKTSFLKRVKWVPALAAAAALSLVGVGISTPADAAVGNINPDTPSSLTIHKYDGDQQERGDGTEINDPSSLGDPLDGVEFTITPVTQRNGEPIDLDTAPGWDLIDGATVGDVKGGGGYTLGTPQKVTTGGDGTVTTDLPHGLYLVEETGSGDHNVISPAEPFLVTLPLPQSGGKWLYDAHVYPKNKTNQTTPTKEVAAPATPVLGNTVTWTITAPVPNIGNDDTYRSFAITDSLDPRLTCESIAVEGFTSGTDYTATCDGQTANVKFTSTGLGKLTGGDNVKMTVTTTVTSLGDNGVIENDAVVNTNGSEVTSNPAKTNWGPLQILKYADDDTSATLSGAVFEVYADRDGQPIGKITTGSNGTANISLWVGNGDTTTKNYWVKETEAPAGYVLPSDPWSQAIPVVANGEASPYVVQISNTQKEHGELPFTGADGKMLLTLIGIALLLLAIGAAVIRYTRRARQS